MNKILNVKITNFWGDKNVAIYFDHDINFLIGANGSGKTTIINLIAAGLTADFETLDRAQFDTMEISLGTEEKQIATIRIDKKVKESSPYPNIEFIIQNNHPRKIKKFSLHELEEDNLFRYYNYNSIISEKNIKSKISYDLNSELKKLVNVSWLTIHRVPNSKLRGERNFESTIDQKIQDLQHDLIKYFSQLNKLYSDETEKFQKYIFESLIDSSQYDIFKSLLSQDIDSEKEKESLRSIFQYFKIEQKIYSKKIDEYFSEYKKSSEKIINEGENVKVKDFGYLLGLLKIHAVVEEWNKINDKQKQINKTKEIFLKVLNSLLIRKKVFISEKNELMIETQSGKVLSLTNLSSGEKQLIIIFGQSLLQGENTYIYIADEPELSLHIDWQEKLVKNLRSINPNSQIIFATHSPDIVSSFGNKVLNIEKHIY